MKAASKADKTGAEAVPFRYKTVTGDTIGNLTAGTAAGVSIAAGADRSVAIDVDVRDLPDGKPWVYVTFTETVNSPVAGGVIAILSGSRYNKGLGNVLS